MAIRTVTAEDEGLASAIADTENEIFSEANGNEPLDNDGDKSLEQQGDDLEGRTNEADEEESEAEVSEEGEEAETEKEAAEAAPERVERTQGSEARVPSGKLREEAERRRAAETEASTLREQIAALNGRLDQLSKQPQQQAQVPKATEVPDMFSDPEGWQKHLVSQLTQSFEMRQTAASFQDAADANPEKFKEASDELNRIGAQEHAQFGNSATVRKIWASPNPGKALMNWHNQQGVLREVGNDPGAYRDKLAEQLLSDPKFLAKAIETARGSARQGSNGQARTITRLPPSLNGESGRHSLNDADPEMLDNSEGSVFRFATG